MTRGASLGLGCRSRRRSVRLALCLVLLASPSGGHPTDQELREAADERKQCSAYSDDVEEVEGFESARASRRIDPARLGMSVAHLHLALEGLRPDSKADDVGGGLARWVRDAEGDVSEIQYESWQDRVYLIRWRLAASFERPVMDEYSRRARGCFGVPHYDQTFEAEPGSPKATLRRIAWDHAGRRIELRQLHPLHGGPIYLSVTTQASIREIGEAGRVRFPDPDQSAPWWRRPAKPLQPATNAERERLGRALVRVLAQIDH